MVSIEHVYFFNNEYLPCQSISHSGPSLVIYQKQDSKKEKVTHTFFFKKSDDDSLDFFDSDVGVLEIILDFTLGFKWWEDFTVPLKVTKENQQVAYLLFKYFAQDRGNYSVDKVLSRLVNSTLKMNLDVLKSDDLSLKLIDFMQKNVDKQLKVSDYCSLLHFSESSINRLCKKQTGMSVTKLFRKIQCMEAERLLGETSLTIREISKKLGFKNSKHFSTMYRKTEGMSPLEKRRAIGGVLS